MIKNNNITHQLTINLIINMDDNLFFKILNEKHRDLVETGIYL
jgi:hypothetical protein